MEARDDLNECDECGDETPNPEDEGGMIWCSAACEDASREREADARAAYAEYRALFPDGMKRDGPQTLDEVCAEAWKLKR